MTKNRKPAAITFPVVSKGVRRNAGTGIEIHSAKDDMGRTECTIYRTERDGSLSYWGSEFGINAARALATERVETVRDEIADAYMEALRVEVAETDRLIAEIVEGVAKVAPSADASPASRVVKTLLSGARMSAQTGFVQVARERLARAVAILSGGETVVTDAQADAGQATYAKRLPVGTRVELTTGQRYGLRAKIVREPVVWAEYNRCSVLVKIDGKGYTNEWCDSLVPLVGPGRP